MIGISSDLIPAADHATRTANQIGRLRASASKASLGRPQATSFSHQRRRRSRAFTGRKMPCPAHWVTVLVVVVFYDWPHRLRGVLADNDKRYLYRCIGDAIIATFAVENVLAGGMADKSVCISTCIGFASHACVRDDANVSPARACVGAFVPVRTGPKRPEWFGRGRVAS